MTYTPPLREMRFVLHEVLNVASELSANGIEVDEQTINGVIEGAGDFYARVTAPLNESGDKEGCRHVDGAVITPAGFKEAYDEYIAAGWTAVDSDEKDGGGGLPTLVGTVAMREMASAANASWTLFSSLTASAYKCLNRNATDEINKVYLPKLAAGQWSGTMCLTESDAGTDLGLLSTEAVPTDTGSYRLTGTKIFITSGEHDFVENIVHLVLARLPDAPAGTRGISLFVVPKMVVGADGEITGERNGVYCDSIEEKMGLHGSSTCVIRFDQAEGQLVGELNKGLMAMFVMMNAARLGTGVQALGLTELARQKSTAYARERLQSRAPKSLRNPDLVADPIINQPDVRRMLLTQHAWASGGRLFLYWLGMHNDLRMKATDPDVRQRSEDLMALLTPVAKSFASDKAVECASLAMQVLGGAGYITDYGVEQIARDARILPIYEGTNGVQGNDLLHRKVIADQGRSLTMLLDMVREFTDGVEGRAEMAIYRTALADLSDQVETLAGELTQAAATDDRRIGASGVDFLNLVGYYVYAYFWARAADVALKLGDDASPSHKRTIAHAAFYFDKLLPETVSLVLRAKASTDILMDEDAIAL